MSQLASQLYLREKAFCGLGFKSDSRSLKSRKDEKSGESDGEFLRLGSKKRQFKSKTERGMRAREKWENGCASSSHFP